MAAARRELGGRVRQHPGSTTALRGLLASLALRSARPWRAMGIEIDLRGAQAARRACAALCGAAGGRRAAADVDRLLVAIGRCWRRRESAPRAGVRYVGRQRHPQRRRSGASLVLVFPSGLARPGHRAAAGDQHDTRRHTATSAPGHRAAADDQHDTRRHTATSAPGHRAAAGDQHDTRRHTATSMMLMLLPRPPAAPRG